MQMQHPGLDSCIVTEKIVQLSCMIKSLYFTMAEPKQRYLVPVTIESFYYQLQRSWAKVIFLHVSVILLTRGVLGGVWSWGVSKFFGGLQFFGGGGWEVSPNFQGGVSKFLGGLQIFGGLQFFGGSPKFFFFQIFFLFFSNLFFPKFLLGCTTPPTPPQPRWSMRGRCASYWNAFLFVTIFQLSS